MARVIVKFPDGEEKTGDVLNFNMNKPLFFLDIQNEEGNRENQRVRLNSVKMICFLKREEPHRSKLRMETIDQTVYAGTFGFRITLEFLDGEVLTGSATKYNPNDAGFIIVPLNPADRSERIYVNAGELKNVDCKKLIGKILVDQKKLTPEQLETSLKQQKKIREKKIGKILVEKAIIKKDQLQESLQKQKEIPELLGQILLDAGYITSEQLDYALKIQEENRKKRLGQILVGLKYLTPNDICIALATQFHLPWIDLSQVNLPAEIMASLPEEVIREVEVIPVERKGGNTLLVATSRPQDPNILAKVSRATPLSVSLVVAFEGYIESAIQRHFPQEE